MATGRNPTANVGLVTLREDLAQITVLAGPQGGPRRVGNVSGTPTWASAFSYGVARASLTARTTLAARTPIPTVWPSPMSQLPRPTAIAPARM